MNTTLPESFGPATRAWFTSAFREATPVQTQGWERIARGEHALLLAPTGSGKTLAAFLYCLDRLSQLGEDALLGYRVLYISPLKALAVDVDRNLRAPLVGIARAATRDGVAVRPVRVDIRTGDTTQKERRDQRKHPGDILITTPESLFLLLGSQARETLRTVETVIVDEIHVMAGTKRGAHLALSLERLSELTAREPQRIGLSATQRPLSEIARYLGGERPVAIVDTSERPRLDLKIILPPMDEVPPETPSGPLRMPDSDGGQPKSRSLWPAIYPRLLEQILAHRTTILFVNNRRMTERIVQHINELAGTDLVRPHHGSMSHVQRSETEEALKEGRVRGIVATSSLELGIDMGTVDLVVLVESPGSVARGLQRIGRAGHGVGEVSIGRIFPKFRGDLLECAVVARLMLDGDVEPTRVPRNTLDVLAQHVVAHCAVQPRTVAELEALARKTHTFRDITRDALLSVLDMLSGRYPSDELADLRPRLVWDRSADTLTARRGAGTVAAINAGTIPDRGLFAVTLGHEGPRIGELDEEMVYESRVGETFLLGASSWRILEITRDRVVVEPAPGEPGKMPFWKGEGPGRPIELGRALGAFVRRLGELEPEEGRALLEGEYNLDPVAAEDLVAYIEEQRDATGTLPTDRAITIERFRDEVGDWRVAIHTPFGARVHAPWALAIDATLSQSAGFEVQTLWSDDGIVLRLADVEDELPGAELLLPDPDEVAELVTAQLGRSALFASRFRENAGRSLLLPRRRPDQRTPLWAQRIRSQNLLAVASRYPSFPIVLETYRECLQDVFDLPALTEVLRAIRRREIRVDEVETRGASPFARSLVFAYVAAYLYEGDAPLAERRAQALTLDRTLLRELLGQEELRELLDAGVLDEVEAELQGTTEERRARHADALHDLLRRVGDLRDDELRARSAEAPAPWLESLSRERRVVRLRVASEERWVAVEDVARYRDALGASPPPGLPAVFLQPTEAPLETLLLRYARTHAPFVTAQVAARFGLLPSAVEPVLRLLETSERLLSGEFRPGGLHREWCDPEVLRMLRRRSLARLRREVAPVEADVLARFLPQWMGVGARRAGPEGLLAAIALIEGIALPFSELERTILPARCPDYTPARLDELGAMGLVVWVGRGSLGASDGRIALFRRDRVALLLPDAQPFEPPSEVHEALLGHLHDRGASFFAELLRACAGATTRQVQEALWDLVWAGLVTNDTFQPLRSLRGPRPTGRAGSATHLAALGRWSLVDPLRAAGISETERAHARATMLLERYGVVSREMAAAEEVPGGFSSVYPVLRAMEESGRIRRGHFAEGLTGSQFALPGAVDRLRAARIAGDEPSALVLSAVDPAQPYGAILPWPDREGRSEPAPRRATGASVVLSEGHPLMYVEHRSAKLHVLCAPDRELPPAAIASLSDLAQRSRGRMLRVDLINGEPARTSPYATALRAGGFSFDHRGLFLEAKVGASHARRG